MLFFNWSTKTRFFAATLGILLFLFILGLTAYLSISAELERLRQHGRQKLTLYGKILESELKRHQYLPLALAKNKNIIDFLNDLSDKARQPQLNRYLEEVTRQTDASAVYLMDVDGLTVASSNWQTPTSYVGHNYSFRPYFQEALKGQAGHYFAIGATTKTPGLFLSYPVVLADRSLGVVAVKVSMAPLEEAWARQGPEKVFLADANGVVFTSSEPRWVFRSLAPLSSAVRKQIRQGRKYLEMELSPLGLEKIRMPGLEDIFHIPPTSDAQGRETGVGSYYLVQQLPLSGSPWNLHIATGLLPVASSLINALAISAPTALALLLLLFYLAEHRFYALELKEHQRRAQQELEASAAEQRAIIDHTRAALLTLDPHGNIESFNPTAEHFFGYREDEVRGQALDMLLDNPEPAGPAPWLALPGEKTRKTFTPETRGRRKNGSVFTLDMTLSAIRLQRGDRYLVTMHDISRLKAAEKDLIRALDEQEQRVRERTAELRTSNEQLRHEITERKRAESILRETQDDLIQASKLAALGQMSAGIAHELNQPLTAIRTFCASGRLLLQRKSYDQADANFARISELAARIGEISGHLKTFARKSSGQMAPVPLKPAITSALSLMEKGSDMDGVEIRVNLPPQEVCVLGDRIRLEQVLINLFSNALDAMKKVSARRLEIEAQLGEQTIHLRVRDSGSGISEQTLGQIFDPFFTTKEVGEGLGLGLSITYGIIKDWGGAVRARNHEGGGAEFVLELPRAATGGLSKPGMNLWQNQ